MGIFLLLPLRFGVDVHVYDSYWEDKEHTDSVMVKDEHGTLWMHTGDEAVMDAEGYVRSESSASLPLWV